MRGFILNKEASDSVVTFLTDASNLEGVTEKDKETERAHPCALRYAASEGLKAGNSSSKADSLLAPAKEVLSNEMRQSLRPGPTVC